MSKNNAGDTTPATTREVVVEQECVRADGSADLVVGAIEEKTAAPKGRSRKGTTRSSSTSRKRTPAKPPASQLPEDVNADYQAVRERLRQVGESIQDLQEEASRAREQVQAALSQTGGVQVEANQSVDQLQRTAREVNEQAGEALREVRQARQEADQVRLQVGQLRQDAGQARQELDALREQANQLQRQQDEAGQKTRSCLQETEQALNQLHEVLRRHEEANRQVEEVHRQLQESRDSLQAMRQQCQAVSQALDEARLEQEQVRQRSREAAEQMEQAARQANDRLSQLQSQLEEEWRARLAAPVVQASPVPGGIEAALTSQEALHHQAPAGEHRQETPAAEHAEEGPVIRASVRPETPRERILRHLEQAWAVKDAVADALQRMADEVVDPGLRTVLEEQRDLTRRHRQELEERLRALGGQPGGGKGILQRLFGWVWESWQREPDDYDRTLQDLVKATTAQQAEVTLAQTLGTLAAAGEDAETAGLACRQQAEKQLAVERLQQFAGPLAEMAVRLPASARAAAQQILVEAGVTAPLPEPGQAKEAKS